jgi:hypothetical protein
VRDAIATLPWVETSSIKTDANKMQVMFTVKDASQFSEQAVIDALNKKSSKYGNGAKKLTGPTV